MMPHSCVILSWDPTKRMRAAQNVYCCSATDSDTPQRQDESFRKIPSSSRSLPWTYSLRVAKMRGGTAPVGPLMH